MLIAHLTATVAAALRGTLALLALLRGGPDTGRRVAAVCSVPAAGRRWLPRWTPSRHVVIRRGPPLALAA
ncbi:hypothetical protein [Kitasatospora cathayae]|uniref:Uncharacterized protein n=1 Tax=Kitasatospora cathayae TaxID=3004092 RepID=A0ABY7PXT8_9ACTN|nr:hypothetical protein [Kitasatospora sp. HUAS 3-15]WBP84982.1 hypothetical protein O1G21_03365 [Kitasatospora sp. HUAS 3-15]